MVCGWSQVCILRKFTVSCSVRRWQAICKLLYGLQRSGAPSGARSNFGSNMATSTGLISKYMTMTKSLTCWGTTDIQKKWCIFSIGFDIEIRWGIAQTIYKDVWFGVHMIYLVLWSWRSTRGWVQLCILWKFTTSFQRRNAIGGCWTDGRLARRL